MHAGVTTDEVQQRFSGAGWELANANACRPRRSESRCAAPLTVSTSGATNSGACDLTAVRCAMKTSITFGLVVAATTKPRVIADSRRPSRSPSHELPMCARR